MTAFTWWAVKHVPTGGYLPEPAGRMGRGGSHVEPTTAERPRLFPTKKGAANALSQWLKGKFHHSSGYDSYNNEHGENVDVRPVPSRTKAEMLIVEMSLQEITQP